MMKVVRSEIPVVELRRWIKSERAKYSAKELWIRGQRKSGEMTLDRAKRMREVGRMHRGFLFLLERRILAVTYFGREMTG